MINVKYIVYLLSSISFFLCFFQGGNSRYEYIFLLPLSFGVVSVFFLKVYEFLKNSVVFNIFVLQAIIRYCIVPFKIASGDYIRGGFDSLNGATAIFFMLLEIVFIFIALNLIARKHKRAYLYRSSEFIPIENSYLLYSLILVMFIYIYISGFLVKVNFVLNLGSYIQKYIVERDDLTDFGFAGVLFTPFKIISALFLVSKVTVSTYFSPIAKKYLYLVILLTFSLFIVGTSRLSILLFILPLFILISSIIDRKFSKQLIIISCISLSVVLFIASVAKFTRDGEEISSDDIFSASSLNAYFSGPGNVAIGLDAYEELGRKENILFFFNDIFQNIPGISKYTVAAYKTNVIFNRKIYAGTNELDQIVPLSISGVFHFNMYGFFLYVVSFLLLALYMERKAYNEQFLGYRYVFISLSTTLSMIFMLNIGFMFFSLFSGFLFVYIPFYFVKKLQRIRL